MGAYIVYWRIGPNCYSLLLLCPLNTIRPVLCLVVYFIVSILFRWVSYIFASIILPSAASAFSFSSITLSYIVKALAFKALYY